MLFIEDKKGLLIKPEKLKHSCYIRDFNIQNRSGHSFFLLADCWDKFTKWMSEHHPDIIMELEYPALGDSDD